MQMRMLLSITSALETILAPFASYSESEWCAEFPEPDSTRTSKPNLVNFGTEFGTIATRVSSPPSTRTPNFIASSPIVGNPLGVV